MKKEDIHLSDWQRILFGDAPVQFLIEVVIRSIITYIILLIVLKLMGKRMSGKLTNAETAVVLMFGAIVSSAMQIPDRGVLTGIYVLFLVLGCQYLVTRLTVNSPKLEQITLGTMTMLVKDGVMQPQGLERELLSKNQLFRALRNKNIDHLGEVKRLYMETNGQFTIYLYDEPRPGLVVYPSTETGLERTEPIEGKKACCICGAVYDAGYKDLCSVCESDEWGEAVLRNKDSADKKD